MFEIVGVVEGWRYIWFGSCVAGVALAHALVTINLNIISVFFVHGYVYQVSCTCEFV
jgi:ABC-type multidrug transport system permease subunit